MNALLFDLYSGGHHLEYADRLAAALRERDSALSVELLTARPTEEEAMYFDEGEIDHLYDRPRGSVGIGPLSEREPFATVSEFLATEVLNPRWEVMRDLVEYVESGAYDVVHVLEIDRIHADALCHLSGADTPPIVGSINGRFFKPGAATLPCVRPLQALLRRGLVRPFTRYAPRFLREDPAWNRWYLERCLDGGVFDHLLVHSIEAEEDVVSYCGSEYAEQVSVVPDPLEPWDRNGRTAARRELDLPADGPMLLFFGQMREEKGIDTVLAALEGYDGPEFTMVLAGPPTAVTEDTVAAVDREADVDVVSRLEFVPQSDVETYFRAADGVVLPYERSFGELRTSGVFQKACAAGKPVIASDFGIFGRRVRQWDLGVLCEPGSGESLREAFRTFVTEGGDVYDEDAMAEYADSQTYERLAEGVREAYHRAAAGE